MNEFVTLCFWNTVQEKEGGTRDDIHAWATMIYFVSNAVECV